jgi:hypothetical protein
MVAHIEDEDRIEKLARRFEPKIVRMLEEIGEAFTENGYLVEGPFEMTDEEPAWSINVYPPGSEASPEQDFVDVTIHIAISEVRDGEPNGMSFLLDTVHYGGQIIGGFAPFNYTPQVWVARDEKEEVDERWHIFDEGVSPEAVVESVKSFYARRKKS